MTIGPVNEAAYGVDLDKDGVLATADHVAFDWAPLEGRTMSWVGRARTLPAGEAPLAAGLYPLGAEFVHTVRYVDIEDATGAVRMSKRIKELRYMKKTVWQTYADLEEGALAEMKEDHDFPDRLPNFDGNAETGLANGTGWRLQAFIEDRDGDLRPQSFNETVFCAGCHGGLGVTDDSTFAFPRKLAAPMGGWFHWSQHGLAGIPDPVGADGIGEYARYLKENGAGDEFRANREVIDAFFDPAGKPKEDMLAKLRADVAALLYPSRRRALDLDKAYRAIVEDQDYVRGRDATDCTGRERPPRSGAGRADRHRRSRGLLALRELVPGRRRHMDGHPPARPEGNHRKHDDCHCARERSSNLAPPVAG